MSIDSSQRRVSFAEGTVFDHHSIPSCGVKASSPSEVTKKIEEIRQLIATPYDTNRVSLAVLEANLSNLERKLRIYEDADPSVRKVIQRYISSYERFIRRIHRERKGGA